MVSFSVVDILECVGGQVANSEELGSREREIRVEGAASLGVARAKDVAFFFSRAFEHELPQARPGILITGTAFVQPLKSAGLPFWKETAVIACRDPYLAM